MEFVGKVGSDKAGDELKQFVSDSGLSTEYIQTDYILPTSEVLVHLDENQNATYEICEPVAWDKIILNATLKQLAEKTDVIVFGSLASRNEVSASTLKNLLDGNKLKVMDVNLRSPYDKKELVEPLLELCDIVKLNDEELIKITSWHNKTFDNEKSAMLWFSEFYTCDRLCVTRGAAGAILYSNSLFYEHPGYKVKTVDTVGAGDAFLAGLLSAILDEKTMEETLDYASATGAYVVTKEGATPDYDFQMIEEIQNK